MNKNLKKVISAIAALAVSASSIVAFAAGYPDVPETASYKQAVTELTALGVVEGTDNGTFEPDQNVTRAQIAKMIVAALGGSTLSAAEGAKGRDTKFADVTGSHWAAGFVSVATTAGTKFVDGYSDTEFGPEDNVTFAQAVKMIVSALGYEQYAENEGGWPGGYLNYGYTLGIADGVSASNDTELTRAQVAQMIDNALKAPLCLIEGWTEEWNGTQTPKRVKKDSPSQTVRDQWLCLLNNSHDAFVFNGRVKETHKSNPAVDSDKVKFSVEKADNFEGFQVVKGVSADRVDGDLEIAYIGDSGADNELLSYSEILVQKNDDDEYTILSITPIGSNKVSSFAADDYAKADVAATTGTGTIYSYVDENTVKTDSYKVDLDKINDASKDGGFYVNGVKQTVSVSQTFADLIAAYIDGNTTGTVTLIDSPTTGATATDGVYDYVMVTYYKDAVVASVIGDDEECTIRFDSRDTAGGIDGALEVDLTDDNMYYSFKDVDGNDILPTELEENDVLSIAWDVKVGFSSSQSYDVIVSRATAEGKLTGVKKDKYTIGGETYKLAGSFVGTLTQGYEYTLFLDAFGKIASFEETAASKKYAVLDSVYDNGGGNYYATIITPDGKKEKYAVANDKYATYLTYVYKDNGYTGGGSIDSSEVRNGTISSSEQDKANRLDVQERVIVYSITSSDNLNVKSQAKIDKKTNATGDTYKASTQKIGSIKLSESLTSALYLGSEYVSDDKVSTMEIDAFEDENTYVAYGYNKLSDGSYQFVIVTSGSDSISYKTDFVVFSSMSSGSDENGDEVTVLAVADGSDSSELTEVLVDETVSDTTINSLVEGTPIMLKKNTSGLVTDIYPLFTSNALSQGYKDFSVAARTAIKDQDYTSILNVTNLNDYLKSTSAGGGLTSPTSKPVTWVFGAVYEVSKNSMTIAKKFADYTKGTETYEYTTDVTKEEYVAEYDVDADATVIVYDYKKKEDSDVRVYNDILTAALTASPAKTDFLDPDQDEILNWTSESFVSSADSETYGRTAFALLKLVDGDIAEAYIINPSTSRN